MSIGATIVGTSAVAVALVAAFHFSSPSAQGSVPATSSASATIPRHAVPVRMAPVALATSRVWTDAPARRNERNAEIRAVAVREISSLDALVTGTLPPPFAVTALPQHTVPVSERSRVLRPYLSRSRDPQNRTTTALTGRQQKLRALKPNLPPEPVTTEPQPAAVMAEPIEFTLASRG
jgi:hypothetical protein